VVTALVLVPLANYLYLRGGGRTGPRGRSEARQQEALQSAR
jgi:hypothetical protein